MHRSPSAGSVRRMSRYALVSRQGGQREARMHAQRITGTGTAPDDGCACPGIAGEAASSGSGSFLKAAQQGDIDGLVRLLHPGVTRTADPHALPAGTAQRVQGAQTVITETLALQRNARRARVVTI